MSRKKSIDPATYVGFTTPRSIAKRLWPIGDESRSKRITKLLASALKIEERKRR